MTNVAIWGSMGNAAYSLPMAKLTPDLPNLQAYALVWSLTDQALTYVPVAIDLVGNIDAAGSVNLAASKTYSINAIQVVAARRTGWVAPTGTATRSTFDTATITLPQLAERLKALLDDLTTHGLIGA